MADLYAIQNVSEVSSGTSALTLIQLVAPTNQRLKIREVGVSFQGTTNTNAPVKVQLHVQTNAGTASAGTPGPLRGEPEAIQAATQITFTAEPTGSTVLREWNVHPQGLFVEQLTDITVKGGARVGLTVTAGNSVPVSGYIIWEE